MITRSKSRPTGFILGFYALCFLFRAIEYLVIRTDQSIIGEAFMHKLAGIALLAAAVWLLQYKWADIGFRPEQAIRGTLWGLLLGGGAFTVAYGVEMLIHVMRGSAPSLQFYVTSYAAQGNRIMQDGFVFVLICIAGNIINVVMEEGVFRGLFLRLMQEKYTFAKSCFFSSILFGIWHIAQPVRNLLDGEQSPMGALMSAILLVAASTLLAIQFCMLFKVTGSLWACMAAHFVNNAGVNLLHVSTAAGADQLQMLRIAIAQALSFVVVLVLFLLRARRKKRAQASPIQ
ncbi:MAG: CPBP family intramembrane glutamic endopeptidase [Christensenellales bacterium]